MQQQSTFFSLEQVIDRQPLTVSLQTPLQEVIGLMHEWGNSCTFDDAQDLSPEDNTAERNNSCVLITQDNRLQGIFTERDLVKLVAKKADTKSVTVGEMMVSDVVTLTLKEDTDIFTALSLLREHRIRHLPIVDNLHNLIGLITAKSLRQKLQPINLMRWREVSEVMNTEVVYTSGDDSVINVAVLMAEHDISCVAICDLDRTNTELQSDKQISDSLVSPVGIITERDIVQFQNLGIDLEQPARNLMSTPLFLVSPQDSLWKVYQQMKQRRVRRLLVADNRGELTGIITQTSLLQIFDPSEMYGVIEVLQRQVCQLESEREKLLQERNNKLEQEVEERTADIIDKNHHLQLDRARLRQSQAEYEQQLKFERLITKISAHFLTVPAEQLATEIQSALETISKFIQVETSYVFRFDEDHSTFSMTHEWSTVPRPKWTGSALTSSIPEIDPQIEHAQNLPVSLFPWAVALIKRGETISVNSVSELPIEAATDRESWQTFKIKSLLIIPYREHERIVGWLGFASFSQEIIWSPGKINLLQVVGEIFASTLQRQQASLALQASEQKFNSILSYLKDIVWSSDAQTLSILYINSAVETICGRQVAEFYQNPRLWLEIVHPEDREGVNNFKRRLINSGSQEIEYRILRPDGEIRWILDRAQVIYDENNQPLRLDGIASDISDRKRAESQIRQQAALLNVATDAIMVLGLDDKILFWNQGAENLYGWTATEVLAGDVNEPWYRRSTEKLSQIQQAVLERGEWQGELNHITQASQEIIVESRWSLVKDDAGNPQSYLVVNTDITEQKQLEAQFLRAQRLESLGTLAGGIAHDLNNILAPILGFSKLLPLRLPNVDQQTKDFFKIIENNANRGTALVKQILTFSRGLEGEKGIVQIRHLITEIGQIIQETFPKSIELELNAPKNLWTVNADVNQLHQVLMNLSVNARDAMPDGGRLTINAENTALDAEYARLHLDAMEGSYVLITVSDTGVGIAPEIIDRIFEPFFTTKEVSQGTGLGLSTVIGIIKSHDGFIDVASNKNPKTHGTQFTVFLPASDTAENNLEEPEEILYGNGELILVVDDEAAILEVTKATLETYNYQVLTARDGIDAIAIYAQHQQNIKVVIMDIMMPSMDGKIAIKTLRKINPEIKIIAVSGLIERQEIVAELDGDVTAFLNKPYSNDDLLHLLHEIVSG